MTNSQGASTRERQHLKSSQDRKVTPRAYYLTGNKAARKRARWVPSIHNSFGLPAKESCPGRTHECESDCYAVAEGNFSGVQESLERNFLLLLEAEEAAGEEGMYLLLSDLMRRARRAFTRAKIPARDWVYRVHWSGDFFSVAYARAWRRVMLENTEFRFWAYTRSFRPGCNVVPVLVGIPNFKLHISADSENLEEARQVAERWGLPFDPLGVDIQHGHQLHAERSARGMVCPENEGTQELIGPDRANPQNGRGACLDCRVCFNGSKVDVIFIKDKRSRVLPQLFQQPVQPRLGQSKGHAYKCGYRDCLNLITPNSGRGARRIFCDRRCQLAEYQLRVKDRDHEREVEVEESRAAADLEVRQVDEAPTDDLETLFALEDATTPKMPRWTRDQLLEHLRNLARAYRRRPMGYELTRWRNEHDGQGPTETDFRREFGSMKSANEEARTAETLQALKNQQSFHDLVTAVEVEPRHMEGVELGEVRTGSFL